MVKEMVVIRNWSELPNELLTMIAENLELIEDFTRFGSVCHSWRSATLDKRHFAPFHKPSLPWLMLAANDDEEEEETTHRFFVPWENNKIRRIDLPEVAGTRYWGSPFGWLVTFGFDQKIHLVNILSHARMELPSISTFIYSRSSDKIPQRNIMNCVSRAFVVSVSPQDLVDDYLVFVVIGESSRLAFARPGDTTWTMVKHAGYVQDIVYLNGRVYFLSGGRLNHVRVSQSDIRVCDISCSEPTARPFMDLSDIDIEWPIHQCYMFELCGELHIAVRILCSERASGRPPGHHEFNTLEFELYKLDLSTHKWDWLVTYGDYALFLGSTSSFCVKPSDRAACMPNCVYFTDNNDAAGGCLRGNDMGVFSFLTGKVEPLYNGDGRFSRFSPPLWIMPNIF